MNYQALKNWAHATSSSLKMKKLGTYNELYVSTYLKNRVPRYSLRLNNIDNRENDLYLTDLLFLIHEVTNSNNFKTPSGLNLSHTLNIDVHWPASSGLERLYKKFKSELATANNPLRQELLMEACLKWDADVKRRVSP